MNIRHENGTMDSNDYEKPNFITNYPTASSISCDTAHGKSIYCDQTRPYRLEFDLSENESVQELKHKLIEKMKTFYH